MKLLHTGDLHLGKRLGGVSLLEDQAHMLHALRGLCHAHQVDAVLICGDVFDWGVPPADAVTLLDSFLTGLQQDGRQVFVIAGNHDGGERLQFGSRILSSAGLHIAGTFTGEVPCVTLHDAWGAVDIWMLPHVRQAAVAHFLPQADTATYDAAVASVLGSIPLDAARRSVLMAHQLVLPGTVQAEGPVSVGMLDHVSSAHFAAFDYVALGHLHRAFAVDGEAIRYAGSPLKYSLSDIGNDKSATLVTLGAKGEVQTECLAVQPLRDIRHITGPIDRLTAPENITAPDDYIYATLTDTTPVLEPMARLRAVYPNMLHLDYAGWDEAARVMPMESAAPQRSLLAHFDAFYRQQHGTPPEPAVTDALRKIWDELADEVTP